jgi:hypothetical protein
MIALRPNTITSLIASLSVEMFNHFIYRESHRTVCRRGVVAGTALPLQNWPEIPAIPARQQAAHWLHDDSNRGF